MPSSSSLSKSSSLIQSGSVMGGASACPAACSFMRWSSLSTCLEHLAFSSVDSARSSLLAQSQGCTSDAGCAGLPIGGKARHPFAALDGVVKNEADLRRQPQAHLLADVFPSVPAKANLYSKLWRGPRRESGVEVGICLHEPFVRHESDIETRMLVHNIGFVIQALLPAHQPRTTN